MDKIGNWWKRHRPSKRRLIQLYAALLCNAHLKGFADGEIYRGILKNVCVPGLNCYSCPGAVGACPLGALQDALANSAVRAPAYILGILLLLGLLLGRTICGFLCPAGLLQDLLYKIPVHKVRKSRLTRALSYLKYAILIVFVIVLPLWHALRSLPVPAFCRDICPAGTLEAAVGLLSNPVNAEKLVLLDALFTRKLLILIAVCVAGMFIYRFFCRFLCPLGAIYSLFSRIALAGVRVDAEKCTGCGICVSRCEMDVRRVGDHECIQCGACMGVCPEQAIRWKGGRILLKANEVPEKGKKLARSNAVRILAAALAIALLGGVLWCVNRPEAARTSAPLETAAEDVCPDFSLPLYGGGEFRLSEAKGKVVVLNFWATWCASCLTELPCFETLAEKYPDDVAVLGIHAQLTTEDVDAFLNENRFSIPMAYDADGSVLTALGGSAVLPVTVVLDREGRIVYNAVNAMDFPTLETLVVPHL